MTPTLAEVRAAIKDGDAERLAAQALSVLSSISPSGELVEIASANAELDGILSHADADELAMSHLRDRSVAEWLEDDFALCVPAIAASAVPLEAWAIPLLSAFAGPGAPLLSFGLLLACKLAILALESWAAKRRAAEGPTGSP